jgi:UDP-N-acetyl-2-amino-2-deoxyglucuronate dehydrogenase
VSTILQLRLHPAIADLRKYINGAKGDRLYEVDLTYVTARGGWYYVSWKGNEHKSGGIATNIGVHFFDMLAFVFGAVKRNVVHHRAIDCAAGYLEFEKARVRWFLSINRADLPKNIPSGQTTFRSITLDGEEIEFSDGFTDLHTRSYREILAGNGFSLDDARSSIETVAYIRSAPLKPAKEEQHPFLELALKGSRYRDGWPV